MAQGGANPTAGTGGSMSVAGGPPVYTSKPMSVVAYSPYRDGQAPGGAQPSKEDVKADLVMLKPFVDGVPCTAPMARTPTFPRCATS